MTATAANALKLAASQNGVQEQPPGSNHCKYTVWFGVTGPWCAMYLSWVFWGIGLRFKGAQTDKGWASAELMRQWFIKHGRYHSTGQVGDVVFYHIPGEHAGANHVGLLKGQSRSDVDSWDGNTSTSSDRDGGHVELRHRSKSIVLGYGRPPYAAAGSAPTIRKAPTWWTRNILLTSPYMRGSDVDAASRRLKAHGYNPGSPTNIAGLMFDKAVRAFQKAKGLKPDGVVGPTTATALGG